MSETMDRINEAWDRTIGNNEAYKLGQTGPADPMDCGSMRMLLAAMPENREGLLYWYNFTKKDIASPTLDEVNARRGYEAAK
jgi:hypothetical protein